MLCRSISHQYLTEHNLSFLYLYNVSPYHLFHQMIGPFKGNMYVFTKLSVSSCILFTLI